jgi:hypothetical protein
MPPVMNVSLHLGGQTIANTITAIKDAIEIMLAVNLWIFVHIGRSRVAHIPAMNIGIHKRGLFRRYATHSSCGIKCTVVPHARPTGTSHPANKIQAVFLRLRFIRRSAINGNIRYMNASTESDQLGPFHAWANGVHAWSIREERAAPATNVCRPHDPDRGPRRYFSIAIGIKTTKANM